MKAKCEKIKGEDKKLHEGRGITEGSQARENQGCGTVEKYEYVWEE